MTSDWLLTLHLCYQPGEKTAPQNVLEWLFENGCLTEEEGSNDRCHYYSKSMDRPQSDMPTERALSELEDEEGYLRLWLDGIQLTFQNWDDYDGVPQLPYYTFKIPKRELKVADPSENEIWKVNTVLNLVANFADKTEVFYGFGDFPAGERASDRQDVDALRRGEFEHIFWFNYFSEPIVSEIGREHLLDAPGERVEERPSGAILLVPYLNLADRSDPHPREVEKYLEIYPP
ncbi:hypothetical protein Halxa_1453 [Halopiger xanaduensis SH-6]|uniref:Uncharacterized protein n=2 Tax=Halopiger xanaduensis TaxID=387343 RepID=F8D2U3_HALXS|nr:hypothetical protein Halxa_1453 [Halopiger xanaduensis SH-6]